MKRFSGFYKFFINKYLLAVAIFLVWILFFDRNDLITQWDRKRELQKLETSKAYYQNEIENTRKELTDLERDTRVIEKFAREKFYLKRANEDVFIVTDSTVVRN
ncbi:MAG: septum formation initiator family protein [Chitinophagaceae bacterium]|nr:septum formation initiator family protein [Chitinophagaceae bacterium]